MEYSLLWGTRHPGHLVYVLDLSESMKYNDKIDQVIYAVGEVSDYLVAQCENFDDIENRFDLTIIGYNSDVFTLFKGDAKALCEKLEQMDENRTPFFDKTKEAIPRWQTYMADAFRAAEKDVREWIQRQTAAGVAVPPPVVIHVTDGFPEEKERSTRAAMNDAMKVAQDIKNITVPDGHVLFFNIHFSGNQADTVMSFPSRVPEGDKEVYRKFLYQISSELPSLYYERAKARGFEVQEHSRFMISNESDVNKLVRLISFGSCVSMVSPHFAQRETPKPDE